MVFQWAKDWVVDKVYNTANTAIQAGGSLAGNAVGGAGSLIENSGRGVGQSAQGAIGGVGGYINNYGQSIIDATAPSGGASSAEKKKVAVKPTAAVSKTAAATTTTTTTTAASKPAATAQKSVTASKPKAITPSPAPRAMPSKPPPPGPQRTLPAKKPTQAFPQKSAGSGLTKIAAGKDDTTADGKIRISPASRPRPAKPAGVTSGPVKTSTGSGYGGPKTLVNNGGPRPLPKISAGKNDRTADGKVKMSAASRPRPVKAN